MFETMKRTIATGSLLALASWPAAAQSVDWQDFGDAVRQWRDQLRSQYRFAFQQPRPNAQPVIVGPGGMAISMSKSFLGVHVVEIDSAKAAALKLKDEVGVSITGVETDSPAEKAGLKVGDVVVEYQGQRVEGTEQFIRLVRETPVGRQVKLTVHRAGAAAQNVMVTIAARKARIAGEGGQRIEMPRVEMWMPDMPRAYTGMRSTRMGVEAEGLEGQLAEYFGVKEGVLVRSVMKGSAADKSGLKAGDVITKVDQKPLDSPRELSEMLRENRDKKTMAITVVREKREMTLNVTPEDDRNSDRPARAVVQDFRF
jgi:serine protease Do